MEKREILEILKRVYDPDYVDQSIVDMGLVSEEDITIKDQEIQIAYGLTAPMCPFSAAIGLMIQYAIEKKLGLPVTVRLKEEHRQAGVMEEVLKDPQKCQELISKLHEFGIMERCVRL
ncbi:hypothetical protein HKBW3S43_01333 [Candidatus Hakubella thermalkaliphila]|uniref:MIP18 family-like domain-containing protein n=1 Tax=Candidatus Hakubella thermalkaliphila TaxID=2754717 RepID=A0A6V8NXA9_9ACTN|nr:iron-sulfur cluster assembly protein [Candidatus Hakubella thermalkaliphila]GFP24879.1 hypothetical protein HKBW3S25_00317 [Candidatus Hakubella thermalkaliphila]GFP35542.1 hypothetical protein HKBW3S43_01333 [Candidatus Hakubella thermalkaliphila]GFP43236.1 hypothetical protein HKBW3C_02366 [Candidatus Hakubella thermalkaliphila]